MKVLIIGGNRFVGLRLSHALAQDKSIDLSIVNRTGQVPHAAGATVYKADRNNWTHSHLDKDWDAIVDFAAYTDHDIHGVLDYFKNVKRYIFISTVSVYDPGVGLGETAFDAATFDLTKPAKDKTEKAYQDGKRRAEAVLAQIAPFPNLRVRLPFMLGPDDYTRRLEFHIHRIERGQPIYLPNLQSRVSMIHAEDACAFLKWSLTQDLQGPINVASPLPISMAELIKRIEGRAGRQALLVKHATQETASPYGVPSDWYVRTDLMQQRGFKVRPIDAWLEELIDGALQSPAGPARLH